MKHREFVTSSCPHVTGLLDTDFDGALLGWVERYDLTARAAYSLEAFVLLAADRWGEEKLVEWLHEQGTSSDPESVVVEAVPPKQTFWKQVQEGLIVWEHLTPAIYGITRLRGHACCVYHHARTMQDLADAVDSSDDQEPGLRQFFEKNIAQAALGARTPLILYSDREAVNNRLGFGPLKTMVPTEPDEITT
jgi:hypothetical protein